MLLLSHTNLRLLKGHRYGLVRSQRCWKVNPYAQYRQVASWKVSLLRTKSAHLLTSSTTKEKTLISAILEYIVQATPRIARTRDRERISEVLVRGRLHRWPRRSGSPQKVGSLSGGWKMKLALARAMLQCAPTCSSLTSPLTIWMLPTCRLARRSTSSPTLRSLALIVSHDSGFLDERLRPTFTTTSQTRSWSCYKGNLAAFRSTDSTGSEELLHALCVPTVKFKFPPPGILTGVKSNTRSILRMTNCLLHLP